MADPLTTLAWLMELDQLEHRANHLWNEAGSRADRQARELAATARKLDRRAQHLRHQLWPDIYDVVSKPEDDDGMVEERL